LRPDNPSKNADRWKRGGLSVSRAHNVTLFREYESCEGL
jgi:hypothetical protein